MAFLKPPFRANDMEGLFKKINKGIFEPIPSFYSKDLNLIISELLKVSPILRPTCDQILKNPIVLRRGEMNEDDHLNAKLPS
jgi:NIMA (never in mitosis gene a)-related kinase